MKSEAHILICAFADSINNITEAYRKNYTVSFILIVCKQK